MIDPVEIRTAHNSGDLPDGPSLQIVLAEYAMLQASLKLSWDLIQQRTSVFFGVLSASAVAIGLVSQASGATTALAPFTAVALAIVLFVGISTFLRVVQALQEVALIILGMNRMRHVMRSSTTARYASLFALPVNDDEASLHRGIGGMHGHGAEGMRRGYGVLQVPGVIAAINAALAGIASAVAIAGLTTQAVAIVVAVIVFALWLAVSLEYWRRAAAAVGRSWEPQFPSEVSPRPDGQQH